MNIYLDKITVTQANRLEDAGFVVCGAVPSSGIAVYLPREGVKSYLLSEEDDVDEFIGKLIARHQPLTNPDLANLLACQPNQTLIERGLQYVDGARSPTGQALVDRIRAML